MENAVVVNVLRGEGYRYCQTNLAEAGIYYKYYQEGFHIVMAVDLSGGNRFSVQQYRSMEEHAMKSAATIMNAMTEGVILTVLRGMKFLFLHRLCLLRMFMMRWYMKEYIRRHSQRTKLFK